MEKGGISVSTENIFPIIKRWLYSEKDIFVREVVSNACDAITKHKRLVSLGEAKESETAYKAEVKIDKANKTITFVDNGIGMSEDEVKRYINQIALSGAVDFISKYEGENSAGSGIIGHFGLGFYSVFMVAESVEMNTKSYTDAPAVYWECDQDGQFSMKEGKRTERGTEIILHIADDEVGYLDSVKLKGILEKYCAFMPYEIHLIYDDKDEVINDTNPLWQRNPADIKDEEYKAFYRKVFLDYRDPIFWVHINADYPLNFKGILYFPAQRSDFEPLESEIKLYYNSVFVADNIKEACPDFLINLKGVLDCPELPLNVSRSYLQNNVYIKKVASHIAKKVGDRLNYLFNNERENYEKMWDAVKPFIEYACMRDAKFYERVNEIVLFKKHSGGYTTLSELNPPAEEAKAEEKTAEQAADTEQKEENREPAKKNIYYATDANAQSYYISLFKSKGYEVLLCDTLVDSNYLQFLEDKNENIRFLRVDADFTDINAGGEADKSLEKLFKKAVGSDKLTVKFAALGENDAPALITVNEDSRRISDMMRVYRMGGSGGSDFPLEEVLTVNTNSPLIKKLAEKSREKDLAEKMAKHIYMSALILSRRLSPSETTEYIQLNTELLSKL
ncbi:MAG TPA: molecular chaperone HtpG [Bacillota bacterium]|nr:molecular chaperone HtpG [Bacillota bacterium]HOK68316.1 molecular chaperone HtpG [Bacillota bacterium]HPP85478.1 molecular chaperone HtpG [Bacillota bacterium]